MNRHQLEMSLMFFKSVFFGKTIKLYLNKDHPYIFNEDELCELLIDEFPKYNNQQLKLHINKYIDYFFDEKEYLKNYYVPFGKNKLNFYDVIFYFVDTIITRVDGRFCFEYEYADIWRRLTREIDEEIFVTAFAIKNNLRRKIDKPKRLDWSYCIEHNNREIKMMLQRDSGVSENHMHLRCSSPYFYLSWVYLMNDPGNDIYYDNMCEIDANRLKRYSYEDSEYSLELITLKASAIRLLLYYYIEQSSDDEKKDIRKFVENEVIPYESNNISTFPINKIQTYIFRLKKFEVIDYAQNLLPINKSLYNKFSGERSILYFSFKYIYEKKYDYEFVGRMLFLYLVMKQKFRTEIVQSNNRSGFYNFAEYEGRKDYFIPWNEDVEMCMATDAICSICDDMKLYRVELRISPKSTWNDNLKAIKRYDNAIKNALKIVHTKRRMSYKKNFFYTLHFPKKMIIL